MIEKRETPPKIVLLTGGGLGFLNGAEAPLVVWCHFDIDEPRQFIEQIAQIGDAITNICISGRNCEEIHDMIDDCLLDLGKDKISTTWHNHSVYETAFEIVDLIYGSRADALIFAAIGSSLEKELLAIRSASRAFDEMSG